MQSWFFDSLNAEQTLACGAALGRAIGVEGIALALSGPLGAGKTVFVKGLAEGLGIDPRSVSSPTFVLAQQYAIPAGPEILHHVDLYRLESRSELLSMGFDDMLAEGQVLAVEWADRFPGSLGDTFLEIAFEGPSPAEEDAEREAVVWRGRRARVTAHGAHAQGLLEDWMERVEGDLSGAAGDTSSAGGKQPTGSSANARKLLLLGLGLAVWGTLSLGGEPEGPGCESLVELESDILGTLHARCREAVDGAARPMSGMGLLLAGERLDLNTVSPSLLAVLPQLGEVRAEAIVRTREDRDDPRFSSVEELVSVTGIGPKIRRRIEPWLTVAPSKWP